MASIPESPEPERPAAGSLSPAIPPTHPAGDAAAVEWRMAWLDGRQFGPTVDVVFAQWISAGRVPAEALVWRTGWTEWRRARDVESDLPVPLPVSEGDATSRAPGPGVTLPPPLPEAPEAASTPTTPKLVRQEKRVGGAYALRRRREAHRRRFFAIALAVVCLALTATLVALMMSGPPDGAPVIPQ